MAKGDHSRAQNKIDEQQTQAQSYLTQTQGQLGNQSGNLYNMYMGPSAPTFGSINNQGSTTPNYSMYQNPFQGNTGTSQPNNPFGTQGSGGGAGGWSQETFNQMFPGDHLSPQQLEAAAPQLAQYGIKVHHNAEGVAGKLEMPDGTFVDVIGGAGSGENRKQYLTGGGGIGSYGMGGIPGMNIADYGKIEGLYGSMLPKFDSLYGDLRGAYGGMIGAASNMANTGGLSEQDKADMRSRAMSPVRSQYQLATDQLDRQRSLQGGYSPGFTTALGRFNRQQGQGISDAVTNADAGIAELVQRGKLGGLSAWGSGLNGMSSGLLGALGGENQAIGGMAGLYGEVPGLTNVLGNQMLQASGQQLTAAGLQNQLSNDLMQNMILSSRIPGNYQSALDNIGGTMKLGQGAAGMLSPFLKDPYNPNLPPGPNNDPGRPKVGPYDPNLIDGGYTPYEPIPGEVYGGGGYGYGGMSPYGPGGYAGDPGYGSNPNSPYIPGPYQPYDPNSGYQI